MKKLGKKQTTQSGTMVTFACDCISVCKSLESCNCVTDASLRNSNNTTSFGKIVAKTMSGENWSQM